MDLHWLFCRPKFRGTTFFSEVHDASKSIYSNKFLLFSMKSTYSILSIISLFTVSFNQASACDSCAIYTAMEAQGASTAGWFTGTSEQFTYFGTTQVDGDKVSNEAHQHLSSSITQTLVGYDFNSRFSVQANLPYIYRRYKRPDGFATDRGTECGIGDLSIIGNFQIMRQDKMDTTFSWNGFAGIKLPTGSANRIKEEFDEHEVSGAPESGIHGHDLALGSGSYDGVLGTSFYGRYQRIFAAASFQYSIRTEGDYNYRYANEFSWEAGVGAYLLIDHSYTLALQLHASGESKGKDSFDGETADDTGMNSFYLGPRLIATWQDKLSADLGIDIPVMLQNTAFQTVPDYRIRGGVTWHF